MQIAISIGFAVVMLITAATGGRVALWSFSSPVLRRALRGRLASKSLWAGLALTLLVTAGALWLLGARKLDGASLFFGGMIFLFGGGAWVFLRLVLDDVRETFAPFVDQLPTANPFAPEVEPTLVPSCSAAERMNCRSERHCMEAPRACGSAPARLPWRQADWQRTGQHH